MLILSFMNFPITFVKLNITNKFLLSHISKFKLVTQDVRLSTYVSVRTPWCSGYLLHNFIQESLDSGSAQVQILLVACQRFEMGMISDNGPAWK